MMFQIRVTRAKNVIRGGLPISLRKTATRGERRRASGSNLRMMTRLFVLVLIVLSSYLAPTLVVRASLASSDWPMFLHDLSHTGRSPYLGSPGNTEKWNYFTGLPVVSSPAIGPSGTIYVGGTQSSSDPQVLLNAINPDGTLRWTYYACISNCSTGSTVNSSPAIDSDGTIYVASIDDNLYAIYPGGSLKWKFHTLTIFDASSPAIGPDGTIYVESVETSNNPGYLYALHPTDGSLKWKYGQGFPGFPAPGGFSSPAISSDGTVVYVGDNNGNLTAINSADGSLKWGYHAGADVGTPSIASDGTIFVGSSSQSGSGFGFFAINPDGSLKWQYPFAASAGGTGAPAIGSDGIVYFGTNDGNLYALHPADGTLKWKSTTGNGSPSIGSDGTLYSGSRDHNLYAINPIDGSVKWKFTTGNQVTTSPAIGSDGTIYFGSYDDNLYAINGPLIGWDLTNSGGITLPAGISGSNTISVWLVGGSSQLVSLSCSGLPAGASCSFNPSSGSPTFASTLTISTQPSTLPGAYTITVAGTHGSSTATTRVSLTVSRAAVGGTLVPIDKLALLAPYIGLASIIVGVVAITIVNLRRVRHARKS
jgi:outer membrane protein assembly factor BamB